MEQDKKIYHEGILIIGPKNFVVRTILALDLIKRLSKSDFTKIKKYLKSIKYHKTSYMSFEKAQFRVAKPTAFSYLEWYASTIVHDTHHYYLQYTGKLLWKKGNMAKHEKLCINEQLRFLKNINAPNSLFKWCKESLKRKHWYKKKRNW